MRYYLFILFIACFGLIELSCTKEPQAVNPPVKIPDPQTVPLVFLNPTDTTYAWFVGNQDTIRWRAHPDSSIRRVIVEYQKDTLDWMHLFEADADSGSRIVPIDLEFNHLYRFRIRNLDGGQWMISAWVRIRIDFRILFPNRGAILKPEMMVYIKYINSRKTPVLFEMNRGTTFSQWERIVDPTLIAGWKVQHHQVSPAACQLRMTDPENNLTVLSDQFFVTDFSDPNFTLRFPKGGERFIRGEIIQLNFVSRDSAVFELSIDEGFTWREILRSSKPPQWIVDVQEPSSKCIMRMRKAEGEYPQFVQSGIFEIDTAFSRYRILNPHGGEVFHAGGYIKPEIESNIGDSAEFYLSTENGASFKMNYFHPRPFGRTDDGLFFDLPALDNCRMKIVHPKRGIIAVSNPFTIVNDHADFCPLYVGRIFRYKYYKGRGGPSGIIETRSIRVIKIVKQTQQSDQITYDAEISTEDSLGNVHFESMGTITESTVGHHILKTAIQPLNLIPARYYSSIFTVIKLESISEVISGIYQQSRGGDLTKAVGLTYFQWTWRYSLSDRGGESWTLIQ